MLNWKGLNSDNKNLFHFNNSSSYHCLCSINSKGSGVSVYISNEFNVNLIEHCTI